MYLNNKNKQRPTATRFVRTLVLPLAIFTLAHKPHTASADVFDSTLSTIAEGLDYIWPDGVGFKDFNYRLGVGIGTMPDYNGSDDYSLKIVPLIDIRYKNIWTLQGSKLRVNISNNEVLKFGPLVNYRFGRGESANEALTGMGDVAGAMQFGAFAEFQTGMVMASAELRQAIGSKQGTEAIFILGSGIYHDDNWLVVVGMRGLWHNATHTQTNYGVNEEQATATGFDVTNMNSGFSNVGVNFIARYQINERTRIENIVGVSTIMGSAADSPLVKEKGSATQAILGVGLRYSF